MKLCSRAQLEYARAASLVTDIVSIRSLLEQNFTSLYYCTTNVGATGKSEARNSMKRAAPRSDYSSSHKTWNRSRSHGMPVFASQFYATEAT